MNAWKFLLRKYLVKVGYRKVWVLSLTLNKNVSYEMHKTGLFADNPDTCWIVLPADGSSVACTIA